MGMKRLGNRGSGFVRKDSAAIGKLMVKQGGFGSAGSAMVPSLRAPLRMSPRGLRPSGDRGRREMVISGRLPS